MNYRQIFKILMMIGALLLMEVNGAVAAEPIKIANINSLSGILEQFGNQSVIGFKMGMEYITNGTMEIGGRPIEIITKDDQGKPALSKQLLTEVYKDLKVDLAVGPTSSGAGVAMVPVPLEFKKILVVEPAVSDDITAQGNRYVFKTSRNSSHDAIGNAMVVAKPGVYVATLAQDYTFGRVFVDIFEKACTERGAKVVHKEFLPMDTQDFTAPAERIIQAMKDLKGKKFVFLTWAGKGNPLAMLHQMKLDTKYEIELTTGGQIIPGLKGYKPFEGMQGSAYYYHGMVKNNPMNDWLVNEHKKRYKGMPPDFFHCGGFAAATFIGTAIKKAGSADTEKLISAMEGLEWMTPKGKMIMRKQDHQALQSQFHFKLAVQPDVEWAVPELVKVQTIEELNIPPTR